jgi:hypothetical protein
MKIREQVKSGKLTPQEAMAQVSPDSHTYGWCKRRGNKHVAAPVAEAAPAPESDEKAKNKYRQKKHQKAKK